MTFSAYTTNSKSCKTMWESTNLNFNQLGRKTTQTPGSETVAYTHIFWNSMFCELTEEFWTHTVNNQRYSTSSGFSECQTHQNFVRTQYLLDNFCFCFIQEQDFSVQPWLSCILKPKHRKISSKCIMKDKCRGRNLSMKWLIRIFRSAWRSWGWVKEHAEEVNLSRVHGSYLKGWGRGTLLQCWQVSWEAKSKRGALYKQPS